MSVLPDGLVKIALKVSPKFGCFVSKVRLFRIDVKINTMFVCCIHVYNVLFVYCPDIKHQFNVFIV